MQINVKSNIDDVLRGLQEIRDDQIPFATAKALTDTAGDVQLALREAMPAQLDRPTQWSLGSIYRTMADKRRLTATVGIADKVSGRGTPPVKWLFWQVEGGARSRKKFEGVLRKAGLLPDGFYAVPGPAARMDSHGNVERSQIVEMLNALRDRPKPYQGAKLKRAAGNAGEYFVAIRGHLAPGVWQRGNDGRTVRPVFLYVRSPQYDRRFSFYEIARRAVSQNIERNMANAMAYAMRTAR